VKFKPLNSKAGSESRARQDYFTIVLDVTLLGSHVNHSVG